MRNTQPAVCRETSSSAQLLQSELPRGKGCGVMVKIDPPTHDIAINDTLEL